MVKKTQSRTVAGEAQCADSVNKKIRCETLVVQGTKYRTLLNKKYKNRKKWEQANEKHIVSYIPGTILKLHVKEGEKVKKGQSLLILEAMKMENTIFAPFSGTLKTVTVAEGDRVPKGQLMVEFE